MALAEAGEVGGGMYESECGRDRTLSKAVVLLPTNIGMNLSSFDDKHRFVVN